MVECARLEIVLRRNTYGGSNPLLCAKKPCLFRCGFFVCFGEEVRTSVRFAPLLATARAATTVYNKAINIQVLCTTKNLNTRDCYKHLREDCH